MGEVAHPGALGTLCLIGAIVTTPLGLMTFVVLGRTAWDGVRGRGWDVDGSTVAFGLGAAAASVGLWFLAIRYLPDAGRFALGAGRVLLAILLVVGAIAATLIGI